MASAVKLSGAPVPSLIIGTIPIVSILISAYVHKTPLSFKFIAACSAVVVGILLVNANEVSYHTNHQNDRVDYFFGVLLAVLALCCWTWYPIRNSNYLKCNPHISSQQWAIAQGIIILPITLAALAAHSLFVSQSAFNLEAMTHPSVSQLQFIAVILFMGIFSSWLATVFWNKASQYFPKHIMGTLLIFEMISALIFSFILRMQFPPLNTLIGVILMIIGVISAVKIFSNPRTALLK